MITPLNGPTNVPSGTMDGRPAVDKTFPVKDSDFQTSDQTKYLFHCVAVARRPEGVAVRDTKDSTRKTLYFDHQEWAAFIAGVKDAQFDV